MPKRFTDSEKWKDVWFQDLSVKHKLFWFYIIDNCTPAGIWKVNIKLVSFQIGDKFNKDELLNDFKDRIIVLENDKWFIPKFIDFQYGHLSESCKPHIPVINELKKYRVLKGYLNPLDKVKVKEQEKDKDKEKEKERYGEYVLLTFEEYHKLVEKFGEKNTDIYINKLDNYIGSKGKKYKSHYHIILSWSHKDEQDKPSDNFRSGV